MWIEEPIWNHRYIMRLIDEKDSMDEIINQIIEDHKEQFEEWENEEVDESIIEDTRNQIRYLMM
jgi:L-lysine 2,3-aminomutase